MENYHRQRDEEDKIRDLEQQLRQLELSAQRRDGGVHTAGEVPVYSGSGAGPAPAFVGGNTKLAAHMAGISKSTFQAADQLESTSFAPDEHGRFKRSASKFRPDFHLDLRKSIDKYTFREYMLGCLYVAETLAEEGRPIRGYLAHLRFIAWKASGPGAYHTQALIKYDQHVSSKVIKGLIPDWAVGEEEAMCLYMGVDGTYAFKQLTVPTSRSAKGAVRGDFSDFPQDVCWLYNFRVCENAACKRKHVCSVCGGSHKGKGCASKKSHGLVSEEQSSQK